MSHDWGRGVGALVVLGALWVLVYWWWEPSRGKIVFEDGPGMRERSPLGSEGGLPPAAPVTKVSTPAAPPVPAAAAPARPMATAPKQPSVAPAPPPSVAPPPRKIAVVPPTFRLYTVKKGDTWEAIAQREMGSRDQWHNLTRANPLMTDLTAGRSIKIPTDPANIQGRPVDGAPADAAPPPVVEYIVKSGDTLGKIAKEYYGSTAFKDLIFTANRDSLEQEDQLKIGQRLKLPPKPN